MKGFFTSLLFVCFLFSANGATYFVSPTGSDSNPGTLALPFRTITRAVTAAVAGDYIYLRGGTHTYTSRINISKNGTAANRFYLWAYPGDPRPVLDFSAMAVNSGNRGISLGGNYWHFYGFDVFKAGDNGLYIDGAFNIIEFCSFYENADSGLQMAGGANNNQIINCDSYFNKDASDGNADGFAVKLDVGTGNSFKGCRAWQNSDDGWDGLLSTDNNIKPTTTYDSCWCFMNGYLKTGVASAGNGNGFKMGGGGTNNTDRKEHNVIMTRCLAAFNRVKGFDQNNNAGSMTLLNCTGYRNAPNYGMGNINPYTPNVMVLRNCVSFSNRSGSNAFASAAVFQNNSWQTPFSTTLANASFQSLDSTGIRGPRNANGTLPHISFMKLAAGSNMIDGGVNVGLPFNGSAPDLGAFETPVVVPVVLQSFEAVYKNNQVVLNWSTLTEINHKGWDIEKVYASSNNPFVWQKVGFVVGGSTSKQYQFSDADILPGNIYQYRLKQIDNDGTVKYSQVITVKITNTKGNQINIYPNPIKQTASVKISLQKAGLVDVVLYNKAGVYLQHLISQSMNAGDNFTSINLNAYSQGNYIIAIKTPDGQFIKEVVKVN